MSMNDDDQFAAPINVPEAEILARGLAGQTAEVALALLAATRALRPLRGAQRARFDRILRSHMSRSRKDQDLYRVLLKQMAR